MKKFLITTVAAAISLPCAIAQSGTSNAGRRKRRQASQGPAVRAVRADPERARRMRLRDRPRKRRATRKLVPAAAIARRSQTRVAALLLKQKEPGQWAPTRAKRVLPEPTRGASEKVPAMGQARELAQKRTRERRQHHRPASLPRSFDYARLEEAFFRRAVDLRYSCRRLRTSSSARNQSPSASPCSGPRSL